MSRMLEDNRIEELATKIISLGLKEPALFFLEAHKPLSGILTHLAMVFSPLTPAILGKEYLTLLQDGKNIELLITKLEG